jgi:hypothetical protein
MNYQFIIISVLESRKEKTAELLNHVNKHNSPIIHIKGSTPDSDDGFTFGCKDDPYYSNYLKEICCIKSHMKALEYAAVDTSPEFSIILEDDTTFYKENFIEIVEETISILKNDSNNIQICYLGWIPVGNFDYFKNTNDILHPIHLSIDKNIKFIRIAVSGTQGYIIQKKNLYDKAKIYTSPTYYDWKKNAVDYIRPTFKEKFNHNKIVVLDAILFYIFFVPTVMFPPIIIERQDEISLLNHNNIENFWNPFFMGHEEELEKYIK